MVVGGQRHAPAALPRERPGTQCIGGWVSPRAGLDGCGKSRPHRDLFPGPSSPYRVVIDRNISMVGSRNFSYICYEKLVFLNEIYHVQPPN